MKTTLKPVTPQQCIEFYNEKYEIISNLISDINEFLLDNFNRSEATVIVPLDNPNQKILSMKNDILACYRQAGWNVDWIEEKSIIRLKFEKDGEQLGIYRG